MMMILSRFGFFNNPQQGVLPPLSLREQAEDDTQDGGVRVSRMPEARSPHSERACKSSERGNRLPPENYVVVFPAE